MDTRASIARTLSTGHGLGKTSLRMTKYGPPLYVSPLIRGVRFALLLAGIIYARGKQALYDRMEASWKIEEAKRKVIRDAKLAELKKKIAAEEAIAVKRFEQGIID